MNSINQRHNSFEHLHPVFRASAMQLHRHLQSSYERGVTKTLFKPFECWRSPVRQLEMYSKGVSKAGAWQSPHQYGMAVDFVPWHQEQWSWSEIHDYDFLKASARMFNADVPIAWDKCHVESNSWKYVKETFMVQQPDFLTKGRW